MMAKKHVSMIKTRKSSIFIKCNKGEGSCKLVVFYNCPDYTITKIDNYAIFTKPSHFYIIKATSQRGTNLCLCPWSNISTIISLKKS